MHEVPDRDAALLLYLNTIGVVTGAAVELVAVGPPNGPVTRARTRVRTALGRTTPGLIRLA